MTQATEELALTFKYEDEIDVNGLDIPIGPLTRLSSTRLLEVVGFVER